MEASSEKSEIVKFSVDFGQILPKNIWNALSNQRKLLCCPFFLNTLEVSPMNVSSNHTSYENQSNQRGKHFSHKSNSKRKNFAALMLILRKIAKNNNISSKKYGSMFKEHLCISRAINNFLTRFWIFNLPTEGFYRVVLVLNINHSW